MGKTLKDDRDLRDTKRNRDDWRAERQAKRRDKKAERGEFVGARVERAKGWN